MDASLAIRAIPAFTDNYIWCLERGGRAWIVDPGEAAPVHAHLRAAKLELAGILVTHHHFDHVGGIGALCRERPVPVWGPAADAHRVAGMTELLREGDRCAPPGLGLDFEVMEIPGHTLGHIALHGGGLLFCGDTLFSAGCGRLFEGTPAQMSRSLARLAALPGETAVHCGHEYTLANLAFAAAVEPDNPALAARREQAQAQRAAGQPSLPSRIADERACNPFLRTQVPAVAAAARGHAGRALEDAVEIFAELRRWKDGFRIS